MALSLTGNIDWLACVRRVWEWSLFGHDNLAPQIPLAKSNEYITALNAAGTGTVNLIKADGSDVVTLAANAAIPTPTITSPTISAPTITGAAALAAGAHIAPGAGSALGGQFWGAGFEPQSSTAGNNTTGVANQQWISSVFVPCDMTVTGIAYLIGTTGGTDRAVAALYNAAGTLLGNSTTTSGGTVVGTGSTLQSLALTSQVPITGPATYLISVQTNGTTAKVVTVPLGIALTGINTAGTTVPPSSITPPTQFNANQGIVATLY